MHKFKYLGLFITHENECSTDVRIRLSNGRSAMKSLNPLRKNRALSQRIKCKLIKALVKGRWCCMAMSLGSSKLKMPREFNPLNTLATDAC